MAEAVGETGLSDWGDDAFREPLNVLLQSCKTEAKLNAAGQAGVQRQIIDCLRNRLLIHNEVKRNPDIRNVEICRPLFIATLPRTGSTLIQRLLSQDAANRSPLLWETLAPAPAPHFHSHGSDPRIAETQKMIDDAYKQHPELKAMHATGAVEPEECLALLCNSFVAPGFNLSAHVPGYMRWLQNQDMLPTYEYYRLQLQILQYRYPTRRWVLKAPDHLFAMDALLAVFPDACVVHCLRDPTESFTSLASLWNAWIRGGSDDVKTVEMIDEMIRYVRHCTDRFLAARDGSNASGFFDIEYDLLVADPIRTVRSLYEHFDLDLTADALERMQIWLVDNRQHKHGKHRYAMEDFHLNRETIFAAIEPYCRRFGLMVDMDSSASV